MQWWMTLLLMALYSVESVVERFVSSMFVWTGFELLWSLCAMWSVSSLTPNYFDTQKWKEVSCLKLIMGTNYWILIIDHVFICHYFIGETFATPPQRKLIVVMIIIFIHTIINYLFCDLFAGISQNKQPYEIYSFTW